MIPQFTSTRLVYFTVHTECRNREGELVERTLDFIRGMTDNGQPGWGTSATHFLNLPDALKACKNPRQLSAWNSTYEGAPIKIFKTIKIIETTIITDEAASIQELPQ